MFSASLQENVESLDRFLKRLARENFKFQLDQCELLKRKAEFLGHLVSPEGVRPNTRNTNAMVKYPIPRAKK